MNYREPPSLPVGARRALRCFSLLLLPALAPKAGHSLPNSATAAEPADAPGPDSVPYLPIVGAPPLRFQRATPPPDLVTRPPAAAAPPLPASPVPEPVAIAANIDPAPAITALPPGPRAPEVAATEPNPPARPAATAILPDDIRPAVRTEDFLPYFQLPGSGRLPGEVNVIVPGTFNPSATPTLPPSSATYTQSPK